MNAETRELVRQFVSALGDPATVTSADGGETVELTVRPKFSSRTLRIVARVEEAVEL